MSIDRTEAAAALAAIETSEKRSAALFHYRLVSPMLVVWGAMWLIADLTIALSPWAWVRNSAWGWVSLAGTLFTIGYWARYSWRSPRPGTSWGYFWRYAATWAFVITFITCVMLIFAPYRWRETHALWGVFFAFLYAINGMWTGWRLAALGVGVGVLTIYAYYGLSDVAFLPFMGVVCGGGMILGGLWLRKV